MINTPAEEALPAQVVGHEGGHLGQGENEDQIEEQLQRSDRRLLLIGADLAMRCRHPHIVSL